jgi:hypothetical protein
VEKGSKTVSDFFVSPGDGEPQSAFAGAFAAYGFLANDHRALRAGSQVVGAALVLVETVGRFPGSSTYVPRRHKNIGALSVMM